MEKKLTNNQIYEAFPDELRSINRNLRIHKNEQHELNDIYKEMMKDAYVRGDDWIISILIDVFRPRDIEKRITELEIMKRIYEYNIEQSKVKKDPTYKPKHLSKPLDVERAKQYPITDIYSFAGPMKRNSGKLITKCPFHEEKQGSFTIYEKTNSFHCFSCQKGGDSIKLYMEIYGCNFVEAVKRLGG